MIRHKIKDEPHVSLVQSGAQAEQSLQAPKLLRDGITPDGIRGADTIVEREIVKGRLQRHDRGSILTHYPGTVQARFPYPHKPDSVDLPVPPEVKVRFGDGRQSSFGNRLSRHKFCKPDTRVDFVNTPVGHGAPSFAAKNFVSLSSAYKPYLGIIT
jgi:hypothetical protein